MLENASSSSSRDAKSGFFKANGGKPSAYLFVLYFSLLY